MNGHIASLPWWRTCFVLPLLSVLAIALPGCREKISDSVEYFLSQPQITAPQKYWECAVIVNSYVSTTRLWPEEDFNTAFDGLDFESDRQVFRISHIDTYQAPIGLGGIGSSFFIHADCTKMQITGEYYQQ